MKRTLIALASVAAASDPSITIKKNGLSESVWLMRENPNLSRPIQNGFQVDHNGGLQFGRKDNQGQYNADSYYEMSLLGGSFRFDVDLSQAKCGCNVALTLVAAPGYDSNGKPWRNSLGTYYCDANQIGGNFCQEMDIMEANKYAWRMTAHKCDAASNKHYWNCDKGGCGKDMWQSNPNSYGPGDQFTINTER
jgi:hypothetical protein